MIRNIASTCLLCLIMLVFNQYQLLTHYRESKSLDPMTSNLWAANTLEAYAVSSDGGIIGESRFPLRIKQSGGKVDTTATRKAFEGKSGFWIIRDYGQTLVFSSYGPATVDGETIAICAEQDVQEVATSAIVWMSIAVVIGVAAGLFGGGSNDS